MPAHSELHSEAMASRTRQGPRRHAPIWHRVAIGAWLLAAGFVAGAKGAGDHGLAFAAGVTFGHAVISLLLAFVFQAVGRLFYRRSPFRDVWTPELFAMATGFVLVLFMLSASPSAAA